MTECDPRGGIAKGTAASVAVWDEWVMRLAGAIVGVTLLMVACAPAVAQPGPGPAWEACGDGLQCAEVLVPLDWSDPDGPTVHLAVARYPATSPDRRGSLFFNPGGPGVPGVDALRGQAQQLSAMGGGHFDVVGWDPRGTGASSSVECFPDAAASAAFYGTRPVPADPAEQAMENAAAGEFARQCGQFSGPLLAQVTTANTARDLDRLRELVGDPELTYYGESYGSFLGQTYANLFPDRVRAMALDGILDPVAFTAGAEDRIADPLADNRKVVDAFGRLCEDAGPSRCAMANGGAVTDRLYALIEKLKTADIAAPSSIPPGALTYGDALVALFTYVSGPATWPEMARGVAQAEAGDGSALLDRARTASDSFADMLPPAAGIACADSPARAAPDTWPEQLDRLTAQSPIYGPLVTWWLWAPCAAWPTSGADVYTGPWNAATANPVLVIGTTNDPNTAYRNAPAVAALLGNAVLLTHDGYGHVSISDPSACVEAALTDYLVSLRTPASGTVCASDRLPFDPLYGQ